MESKDDKIKRLEKENADYEKRLSDYYRRIENLEYEVSHRRKDCNTQMIKNQELIKQLNQQKQLSETDKQQINFLNIANEQLREYLNFLDGFSEKLKNIQSALKTPIEATKLLDKEKNLFREGNEETFEKFSIRKPDNPK
jgi:uncharacterized protein (UPF0335 family)